MERAVPEENTTAGNRPQRPSLLISKITAAPCPRHGRPSSLNSRCAWIRKFRDVWLSRKKWAKSGTIRNTLFAIDRMDSYYVHRVVYLLTELVGYVNRSFRFYVRIQRTRVSPWYATVDWPHKRENGVYTHGCSVNWPPGHEKGVYTHGRPALNPVCNDARVTS